MPARSMSADTPANAATSSKRRVEGPMHSEGWGLFFFIAAGAVFLLGILVKLTGHGEIYSFLSTAGLLVYLGRRLRARGALEALLADRRSPVVYLRSFAQDEFERAVAFGRPQFGAATDETALVAKLDRIGPVVAIGRPGDKLAHLGAARLYVSDDDWQTVARQMMQGARLVVLRAGAGAGLKWELACAREVLPPDRLVLWFPHRLGAAAYAEFRGIARDTLMTDLPETAPSKGFLQFDAGWQPRWVGSLDGIPGTPRAAAAPPADGAAPSTPLGELLSRLGVDHTPAPRFRLHPATAVVISLWLIVAAFFAISFLGSWRAAAATAIESVLAMLAALGLAFIPYRYSPTRRLLPNLVICAVLIGHASWLAARNIPGEAQMRDLTHAVAAKTCRQMYACLPWADRYRAEADCVKAMSGDREGYLDVMTRLVFVNKAWQACQSLSCQQFGACFARELDRGQSK